MYKINISDNSFIIADDMYKLTIFHGISKKTLTVKEYLNKSKKYSNYYLIDYINNKKIKRQFTIEPIESSEFSIGSRIKLAKDIQVGDVIMGSDGNPRIVNELHTGEDEMFEITVNGKSYTVNGGHILALVNKETGEHLEMPVNVFLHMNKDFQSHYVMELVTD